MNIRLADHKGIDRLINHEFGIYLLKKGALSGTQAFKDFIYSLAIGR